MITTCMMNQKDKEKSIDVTGFRIVKETVPEFLLNDDYSYDGRFTAFSPQMKHNLGKREFTKLQNVIADLLEHDVSIKGNIPYAFEVHFAYLSIMIDKCAKAKIAGQYEPQEKHPYGIIIVKDQEQMEKIYDVALKLAHDLNVTIVKSSREEVKNDKIGVIGALKECDILLLPADAFHFFVKEDLILFHNLFFVVVHGVSEGDDYTHLEQYHDMFTYVDFPMPDSRRLIFFDDNFKHDLIDFNFKEETSKVNIEFPSAHLNDLFKDEDPVSANALNVEFVKNEVFQVLTDENIDLNEPGVSCKDLEKPKDGESLNDATESDGHKALEKVQNGNRSANVPYQVYFKPDGSEKKLLVNVKYGKELELNIKRQGYDKICSIRSDVLRFMVNGFDVVGNPPKETDSHEAYICYLLDACFKAKNHSYKPDDNNPFAIVVIEDIDKMVQFFEMAVALAEGIDVAVKILTVADYFNDDYVIKTLKNCDILFCPFKMLRDDVYFGNLKHMVFHNFNPTESLDTFLKFNSLFDKTTTDRKDIQLVYFDDNYAEFENHQLFRAHNTALMKFKVINEINDGGNAVADTHLHVDKVA